MDNVLSDSTQPEQGHPWWVDKLAPRRLKDNNYFSQTSKEYRGSIKLVIGNLTQYFIVDTQSAES